MIDTFTVSFFGHRTIDNPLLIEQCLEVLIRKLLGEKGYIEFLVGRDGEFDQIVSSTIRRCKRTVRNDNSTHVWVLPYVTSEYLSNEENFRAYYDEIEVCEAAANCHYKTAFQVRNRNMVDRSHLVVFYVGRKSGGAYQTMCYANKQGVSYININENMEEMK